MWANMDVKQSKICFLTSNFRHHTECTWKTVIVVNSATFLKNNLHGSVCNRNSRARRLFSKILISNVVFNSLPWKIQIVRRICDWHRFEYASFLIIKKNRFIHSFANYSFQFEYIHFYSSNSTLFECIWIDSCRRVDEYFRIIRVIMNN